MNILIFIFYKFKKIVIFTLILTATIYLLTNQSNVSQAQIQEVIFDQNGDEVIDIVDARISSPADISNCPVCANVNGDDVVDDFDEKQVRKYLGKSRNENTQIKRYDINNDGQVDDYDIQILNKYKGKKMQTGDFGLDKPEHLSYGYKEKELIIHFEKNSTTQARDAILKRHNLKPIGDGGRPYIIQTVTQSDDLDNLAKEIKNQHPEVKFVYKHLYGEGVQSNDPAWAYQWGPQAIGVDKVWFTETRGHNSVKVAVLDTGVHTSHRDLGTSRFVAPYNAVTSSSFVTDVVGHGTAMAGIIGALVDNGQDIAGIVPNVTIIPVNVFRFFDPWVFLCDSLALERGIYHAIDNGANVINMSLTCSQTNGTDSALNAAHNNRISLVASTGNQGRTDGVGYPASHSKVVGVGAVGQLQPDDNLLQVWPDSNRGPGLDMYAPGVDIASLSLTQNDGLYIGVYTGTSPAAAHVSGVAALKRSVCDPARMYINICYLDSPFGIINAWTTVWRSNCFKVDYNHDHLINARDNYQLFRRWLRRSGDPLYEARFDIRPIAGGDGVIDIIDLQTMVALYYGNRCPPWHLHQ